MVNAARREIEEAFQLDDTEIDAAAVGLSRGEDGVAVRLLAHFWGKIRNA